MSGILKKRSMRLSSVSRQSLTSLIPNQKSTSGSRTISGFSESRCFKHSPRVSLRQGSIGEDLAIFEAEQWRGAFQAMGSLKEKGGKAPSPFTVLNRTPYHCDYKSREFEVRYGELMKMQPPVFRKAKKPDRPQICSCITKEVLPIAHEKKVTGYFRLQPPCRPGEKKVSPIKYYLPKSCVYVRWDPMVHSSVDKICEWLNTSFGAFLFTTRTASNSMLVAFETMEQAHRAVNYPLLHTARVYICWHNPAMYNFGAYVDRKNYTIGTDTVWKRGMEEKAKTRVLGRVTQGNFENQPKTKQLRITESGENQ